MKAQETAQILKEVVLKNQDGFTCDFNGKAINKTDGFFIAITNIKGKQINRLINKILYIKTTGFKDNKNLLVGGWKEDLFYLDLSLYVNDFNTAQKIGLLFNQKAVYDIQKKESIYLK